jgi:GLPGLI family protein
MGKYLILLFIGVLFSSIQAQLSRKAISYTYKFYCREDESKEYLYSEMSLITDGKIKYYLPKDKMHKIANLEEEKLTYIRHDGVIVVTKDGSESKHFLLKNLQTKEFTDIIDVDKDRYFTVENNNIVWQIEDSIIQHKKFGIPIQKATTDFKGRKYTAYFAPSIPFNLGPYKFDGLPGLITQLKDSELNYIFNLSDIKEEPINDTLYQPTKILENFKKLDPENFSSKRLEIVKKMYAQSVIRRKEVSVYMDDGKKYEMNTQLQADLVIEKE